MFLFYTKSKPISLIMVLITALFFSLFASMAQASYKRWPLRSKGEVRYLKMIKVYDISLYSPSIVNSKNILDSNISKCLKLDYMINLSVEKFRLATSKVLNRQYKQDYLNKIKAPLEKFQNAYKLVKKGDTYRLCYNAKNKIMRLDLNDKNLIQIKSTELAKVYLGIWLSNNKPISKPLYRSLFAVKQ